MMDITFWQCFFGWSTVLNYALLLYWFLFIWLAHDWLYRFHSRWFELSRDRFDAIHYAGMMIYKLMIFFFNLIPWLTLYLLD